MLEYKHRFCIGLVVLFVGSYAGVIIGMEFWAQSFTDTYLDLDKIKPFGDKHKHCNNPVNINSTFVLYNKYDCHKYIKDLNINCSKNCISEESCYNSKFKCVKNHPTVRITNVDYYRCIKIGVQNNYKQKLVYFDKCYVNFNESELLSIRPANEHPGWIITYVIATLALVVWCFCGIYCIQETSMPESFEFFINERLFAPSNENKLTPNNENKIELTTIVNDRVDTCSICCDKLPVGTNYYPCKCGHKHHPKCLQTWIQTPTSHNNCPDCKTPLIYINNPEKYVINIVNKEVVV